MKKQLQITEIATLPKSAYFPNYQRYRSQILISQIEDLNEDCFKTPCSYLLYFPRNKPYKNVIVGSGRFIVLHDSASPKIVIKMFFKIFELF